MPCATPARILLVDDDAAAVQRVALALGNAGYVASVAGDADAALDAVASCPPDIAVLDARVAGRSGLELGAILRDRYDVPFLFASAALDAATVAAATALGAIAYLAKPLLPAHYVPAVAAALARAGELRAARHAESSLERALGESRAIGLAVGVLMERLRLDRAHAFEALRDDARTRRQRIGEVAEELLLAAELINGVHNPPRANAARLAS
jgi:response regulator NasT